MKSLSRASFMVICIFCVIITDKINAQNQSKANEGSVLSRFKRSMNNASTQSEIETLLKEMDDEILSLKKDMRNLQVYQQRNMRLVYVFVTFDISVKIIFIGVKFLMFTLKLHILHF